MKLKLNRSAVFLNAGPKSNDSYQVIKIKIRALCVSMFNYTKNWCVNTANYLKVSLLTGITFRFLTRTYSTLEFILITMPLSVLVFWTPGEDEGLLLSGKVMDRTQVILYSSSHELCLHKYVSFRENFSNFVRGNKNESFIICCCICYVRMNINQDLKYH